MASGRVPVWVWAALVAGHGVALAWALSEGSWFFPDSNRYLQAAENLRLHGELFARPWPAVPPFGQVVQEFTIRPPGYPVVLLVLGAIKNTPLWVLLCQNLLSLFNVGCVLSWWRRFARPSTGKWAWAVVGVVSFPSQLVYANAVMSEMLLQTAVTLMAGGSLLFIADGKKRYFAMVAGAIVAALLLKPVFFPMAFGLAAIGAVMAWKHERVALLLVALGPLLVVGVYMGWNWQRTGYFHFSSIAEINLLHYNAAGVVRHASGPMAAERWVSQVLEAAHAQRSFAARQELIRARAEAVLWAHPVLYACQHVRGMAALFLDPGRFDLSQFLGLRAPVGGGLSAQLQSGNAWRAMQTLPVGLISLLGAVLLANLLRVALAVRGFFLLKHSSLALRYGRWVAAGLLLYVAVLTGPLGAARFLVPVWPLLLALALAGLSRGDGSGRLQVNEPTPVRKDQR